MSEGLSATQKWEWGLPGAPRREPLSYAPTFSYAPALG